MKREFAGHDDGRNLEADVGMVIVVDEALGNAGDFRSLRATAVRWEGNWIK